MDKGFHGRGGDAMPIKRDAMPIRRDAMPIGARRYADKKARRYADAC